MNLAQNTVVTHEVSYQEIIDTYNSRRKNDGTDRFDIKILRILQQQADISNQELAERVGLTTAPCSRRVKQLQEAGVIQRYCIRLDERAINPVIPHPFKVADNSLSIKTAEGLGNTAISIQESGLV